MSVREEFLQAVKEAAQLRENLATCSSCVVEQRERAEKAEARIAKLETELENVRCWRDIWREEAEGYAEKIERMTFDAEAVQTDLIALGGVALRTGVELTTKKNIQAAEQDALIDDLSATLDAIYGSAVSLLSATVGDHAPDHPSHEDRLKLESLLLGECQAVLARAKERK